MAGLELPRLVGLSVVVGDPLALDQLRGQVAGPMPGTTGDGATDGGTTGDGTAPGGTAFAPIPVTPEECD